MCGIVGFTSREKSAVGPLVSGLRRLEYRGYDSSGVALESPEGRPLKFKAVPNTKETIKADLVFLAMGFTGVPADNPIIAQLGLAQTPRTALIPCPERNIFCVGDCASGASLVVRALASGKSVPL